MENERWVEYSGGGVYFRDRRDALRHVRMHPHLTKIPNSAFYDCTRLREVDLVNVTSLDSKVFFRCIELQAINLQNVTEFGQYAFYRTGLKRVIVPSAVASVSHMAFQGCKQLTEVTLCHGVQTIGLDAFSGCSELRNITIPSTVTEIMGGAFAHCDKLIVVNLHDGLKNIGTRAFGRCPNLQRVTIPSSVISICDTAFDIRAEIEILEGVQEIARQAFVSEWDADEDHYYWTRSLERVKIPSPAFVITAPDDYVEHPFGALASRLSRNGTIPSNKVRMIVSKFLKYMSPGQIEEAGGKINEIIGRQEHSTKDRLERVRKVPAYYHLLDATTTLELAIWKIKIDQSAKSARGIGGEESNRKRARVDSIPRGRCRTNSGAHIIIPLVLPYM